MPHLDCQVRQAKESDSDELARLNWDFSTEEQRANEHSFEMYAASFDQFLQSALQSGNWIIWVAEYEQRLVFMAYVQIIHKVRRPGRSGSRQYGYVTNVFTEAPLRSQGIGTAVFERIIDWAKSQQLEFLVLWPSEASIQFYQRSGFMRSPDALELSLSED
ncbi:MAG TPA: GNAT family N-acetyltransferase [Ktedonobacteraceae bacterium]|nr:GNAT family N-acetyltransferase [Ktedonobacteraceae bacterium]